jgi:hypothetical protein
MSHLQSGIILIYNLIAGSDQQLKRSHHVRMRLQRGH